MSIADINRMQALYAQPTQYDQNAWKTAFDIANAFTNAEAKRTETNEANRRYNENMATSDWRVAYQNNVFQTGIGKNNVELSDAQRKYNNALKTDPSQIASTIAQNNYMTTSSDFGREGLLGQKETAEMMQHYGLNQDGTARTIPEAHQAMRADGKNLVNSFAFSNVWQAGNQEQQNQKTNQLSALQNVLANSMETTTDAMGNIVQTGKVNTQLLDQRLNQAVAMGAISQEQATAFKARLFPPAPNQAVLPSGAGIGEWGFSAILNQLKGTPTTPPLVANPAASALHTLHNAVNVPVATPTVQSAAATQPMTPEQQQQAMIKNLQDWQNGGREIYWQNFWNEIQQEKAARAEAMAKVMQMNQPTLPYYFQR